MIVRGVPSYAEEQAWPDRLALVDKLRNSEFDQLEHELTTYQGQYQQGQLSDDRVDFAFLAFANSDPALEAKLNQWVEARPDSYAALLARAYHYASLAFHSRGYKWVRDTSREQLSAMAGYYQKSAKDLHAALVENANLTVAYGKLIRTATIRGNDELLARSFEAALRVDPDSNQVRESYVFALQPKWGGNEERWRTFLDAYEGMPEQELRNRLDRFALYVKARRMERARRWREALELYDKALKIDEQSIYYYRRGIRHHFLKDYEQAISDFNRALALRPQQADVYAFRAWSQRKRNQPEAALADWNMAIRLDALDPKHLADRAKLLTRLGRHEEAISDLNNALVFGSHDARKWAARGKIYLYKLKDLRKAVPDLRRATELDREKAGYWYDLGYALFKLVDCEAGKAMSTYLEVCKAGSDCQEKYLEAAKKMVARVRNTEKCLR